MSQCVTCKSRMGTCALWELNTAKNIFGSYRIIVSGQIVFLKSYYIATCALWCLICIICGQFITKCVFYAASEKRGHQQHVASTPTSNTLYLTVWWAVFWADIQINFEVGGKIRDIVLAWSGARALRRQCDEYKWIKGTHMDIIITSWEESVMKE